MVSVHLFHTLQFLLDEVDPWTQHNIHGSLVHKTLDVVLSIPTCSSAYNLGSISWTWPL